MLGRALAWDAAGRKRTSLLRGQDLKRADDWVARSAAGARPQPTELEVAFIEASRRGAAQRQRLAIAGALVVAAVAAGLSVFALISRSEAVHASHVAFSRELAADSTAQLDHDPQLALLLAAEALRRAATPASEAAVVAALDASFVRRIVRAGARSSTSPTRRTGSLPRAARRMEPSGSGTHAVRTRPSRFGSAARPSPRSRCSARPW